MTQNVYIENLKCGGCAATIKKRIKAIKGVENVEIDIEKSLVSFNANATHTKKAKEKLSKLGYPEKGSNTVLHKAKSFVSCATGKMNI